LLEIFWCCKWWVSNGLAVDAPQLRVLRVWLWGFAWQWRGVRTQSPERLEEITWLVFSNPSQTDCEDQWKTMENQDCSQVL